MSSSLSNSNPARRPRQAASKRTPPPDNRPVTDSWIVKFHEAWCCLTLSSFYQDIEENAITNTQFARWLLDTSAISMAVLKAATRVNETLIDRVASNPNRKFKGEFPLLAISKEDAQFLYELTIEQGFDRKPQFEPSHAAKLLIELIEVSTAPDAPAEVAITAIWAYMMPSWSGWQRLRVRGTKLPHHFAGICKFLSRYEAIRPLTRTQAMLNDMMDRDAARGTIEMEKATKTFEEVVRRAVGVLDNTLYVGEANQVPLCTCGRKGHVQERCTFKSHI